MKVKRAVFIGIAAACVLVLVLAISGVFGPGELPRSQDPAQKSKPGELVIEPARSEGENWTMTAEKAFVVSAEQVRFVRPVITYVQKPVKGGGPDRTIRISGDEAYSSGEAGAQVHLKKNVVVTVEKPAGEGSPAESGTLHADELLWEKKGSRGSTPGPIQASYTLQGNTHSLTGEGLTANLLAHTLRLERNAHLVLAGDVGLMASTQQAPSGELANTVVTCEGPLFAEEVSGNIALDKNVCVARGDQVLRTDRLVMHMVKPAQGPVAADHWQALGHVRLSAESVELQGKKLLRGVDGLMTLVGNSPCTVKMEAMLIEADSISMDLENGRVTVPGPGKLVMEAKQEKPKQEPPAGGTPEQNPPEAAPPRENPPPKPTTATWSGGMTFDRKQGKATLTKDVHVVGQDIEIHCKLLTLWLSEGGSEIEKLLAEEDVRMVTPQATAVGNSLLYLMKEQRMELKGEPSAAIEEKDHTVACRVIHMDRASGNLSCSAAGNLTATLAPEAGSQAKRQTTVTWEKAMSFAEKEGTAHFEGDVTMNDGLRELYADTMAMNFTQGEKRDLRGVEAAGQVRLNWEGRKGFGDTFQWEAPDGKGFLIGRPARIAFQQGWLKGDNIYFRDNFNEVSVSGAAPSTASMQQKIPHPAPPGGTPSPAPQPKRTSTP